MQTGVPPTNYPQRPPAAGPVQPLAWGTALLVLLAALVRVLGGLNDLWLDEVWALQTARTLTSPLEAFTSLHHEINHYLNTLWLHVTRASAWPPMPRLLSLTAGIGSVFLAGWIGARRGKAEGLFAVLLIGFSYILVLYASEARGYSTAVFFALASYHAFVRYRETGNRRFAVAFSVCGILGLASHLTFAGVLGAAGTCSVYRNLRAGWNGKTFLKETVALYALPLVFLAGLYYVDIRHIREGGGSSASFFQSLGTAMAWGIGTLAATPAKFAAGMVAVSLFVAALWVLDREEKVFFVGAVFGFPTLLVLVRGSDTVYTRHFVLSVVFLLVALSYLLGEMFRRGRWQQTLSVAIVGLFLAVNGYNITRLLQYGRGDLQGAIRYLVQSGNNPAEVSICGSQDFRVMEILGFYGPKNNGGKGIRYFKHGTWPRFGAEFLVVPREASSPPIPPAETVDDGQGNEFRFVRAFPAAPLSGMHWFIYKNSTASPALK